MIFPKSLQRLFCWTVLLSVIVSCGSRGGGGGGEEPPTPPIFEALTKISADLPQVAAQFGYSVDVDGDLAVVGAPFEDDGGIADLGAAYIFRFTAADTWVFEARLTAADGAAGDRFGFSVALEGDDALIGAPFRDEAGIADQGAAYVFRRTDPDAGTWEAITTLVAADGAVGDRFGSVVALAGDDALIGAPFRDEAGVADQGAAYVFRRTDPAAGTWEAITTLLAADGTVGDEFALALALDGNDALVGAPFRDEAGVADQGAAYVFRRTDLAADTWEAITTLVAADGAAGDRFGSSVALSGDDVLIGVPFDDRDGVVDQGAAYVFRRTDPAADTWEAITTLVAADGAASDRFGSAVALEGDDALVGAPFDNRAGLADQGSAYVFRRTDPAADTWETAATLVAADGVPGDRFGFAAALSGGKALVGTPFSDPFNLVDSGAVYPFLRP